MKTLTTILLALILAAAMTCPAWAQTKAKTLIKKEKKKIKHSSPDLTNHSEITAETLKH